MTRTIDYGNLMHRAMRGLIAEVLAEVAAHGLPGAHHFFITFDTNHPDAALAPWLHDRFPKEMTIVLQHWFDNLEVGEDGFGVTLNFGDSPESLYVPYDAIRTFVDPSVEFGLRFETHDDDDDDDAGCTTDDDDAAAGPSGDAAAAPPDGEVVSLDKWRK